MVRSTADYVLCCVFLFSFVTLIELLRMKNILLTLVILISSHLMLSAQSSRGAHNCPDTIATIEAPFEMPQLQRPQIGTDEVVVKGLRKELSATARNTHHIQKAIDRMAQLGGGRIVVPAGNWPVARIVLKSHIELHLSEGARLQFSGEIDDYLPAVFTRDEGTEVMSTGAFIYACNASHIALTGRGVIAGPEGDCPLIRTNYPRQANAERLVDPATPVTMRIFDGKPEHAGGAVFLPKSFAPIHCNNVLVENVTFDHSLYWNVVPQYCDTVIIRGVTVNSFGRGRTDGIDVESSRNVLIEYCTLDCQDDCFTMKSGRGEEGRNINRPTENVVVRHCIALRGASGIVCGTETSGGIRNIYCHDCLFDGTDQAIRLKTRRTRGGTTERVWVNDIEARNILHYGICVDMLGSLRWEGELSRRHPDMNNRSSLDTLGAIAIPTIRSVYINNVHIDGCRSFLKILGLPERKVKDFFIGNSSVRCEELGLVRDAELFNLKDIQIESPDSVLLIDGCRQVSVFEMNRRVKCVGDESEMVVTHQPMRDDEGRPIQAHAFQILLRDSVYYWYGESKDEAIPGSNVSTWGIRCYTSTDFEHWHNEGLIMLPDTLNPLSPLHYSQILERPHILYSSHTGRYVMWLKSMDTDGYFVILQADRFMGPYRYVKSLKPQGFGVGDFDMWSDPATGTGYVWFERPHYEMICSTLTPDYLDVTTEYSTHFTGLLPPFTREAPAHFVFQGTHYMFTSGTTGYTPNPSQVHRFEHPHGLYTTLGNPHPDDKWQHSYGSQICCVLKRSDGSYWALADVWQPVINNTDFAIRTAQAKIKSYEGHKPFPQDYTTPIPKDKRYQVRTCGNSVYNATYLFLPIDMSDPEHPIVRLTDNQ